MEYAKAFSPATFIGSRDIPVFQKPSQRFLLQKEKPETEPKETTICDAESKTTSPIVEEQEKESKGLPWWWEYIWELDIMKRGEPGTDVIFGDTAHVLRTNIEQIFGKRASWRTSSSI